MKQEQIVLERRFVKKFKLPDFRPKILHTKSSYCDYFYSKTNSVHAFISVILVAFFVKILTKF